MRTPFNFAATSLLGAIPLAITGTTSNKTTPVSQPVTSTSTRTAGITVVTTVAPTVEIVQVLQSRPVPIAGPVSTSCPIRQAATVLLIAPQRTMSRLAPTVSHVTRPVSPAMVSPVPTVTLVLMGCFCTVDIVDMCVLRKLSPTRKHWPVKVVMPNASFVLDWLWTTVPVVKQG